MNRATLCALVMLTAWPLQAFDDAMRAWVQVQRTPSWNQAMQVVSDKSRGLVFGGAAIALFAGPVARAVVGETAIALVPVNLAVEGLKWTVGRTRPDGDRNRRNSSFPSSHAANAFTVAAVVGRRWRRAAVPMWLAAFLVGYSRMLLDRHWASDILGALTLALLGAWIAGVVRARWAARRGPAARA